MVSVRVGVTAGYRLRVRVRIRVRADLDQLVELVLGEGEGGLPARGSHEARVEPALGKLAW